MIYKFLSLFEKEKKKRVIFIFLQLFLIIVWIKLIGINK